MDFSQGTHVDSLLAVEKVPLPSFLPSFRDEEGERTKSTDLHFGGVEQWGRDHFRREHTKCGPRDSRDIPGNIPRSAFGVLLDVRDERGRPSDSRRSRRCSASPTTSTFAQQSQIISNVEGIRILGIFLRIAFGVLLDVRDERGRLPTCQRTRRRLPRIPRIAFGVVLVQRDERECEWCPERSYELLSGVIGN